MKEMNLFFSLLIGILFSVLFLAVVFIASSFEDGAKQGIYEIVIFIISVIGIAILIKTKLLKRAGDRILKIIDPKNEL